MAQSSNVTVPMLFFGFDSGFQALASVINVNPTATTYALNCPTGGDGTDCSAFNQSLTVGPWAAASPAATATAGTFDGAAIMADEGITYSIHCVMTRTVPATCTYLNVDQTINATSSTVYTSPASDNTEFPWTYAPFTITAGQEKLGSAISSMTGSTPASPSATTTGSTSGSTSSSASGSKTTPASSSSSAASASSTHNSAPRSESGLGSLTLAGVIVALLLR